MLLGVSPQAVGGVSIAVPDVVLLLVAKVWRQAVDWREQAVIFRWSQGVCG